MTDHRKYKMPPEWHPHVGTQLHWPSNRNTWPGKRLQRVEQVYLNIIEILHRFERIHLFIEEQALGHARSLMENRSIDFSQVTIHEYPINDVWARDCGPIFVLKDNSERQEIAITDWEYNAWGGKYPPFDADNNLPAYIADYYDIPRFEPQMVLEGGAIETNGHGMLLTTESVLLNPNRNPDLSRKEVEQRLKDYLGIQKIIWLKEGLAGDDTDGHIDDLARFLNKDTILAMTVDDPEDVNYDVLQRNLEILYKSTDQEGNSFQIETLPLPQTRIKGTTVDGSEHVPASYANFYIANGVVLMPVYDDPADQQAISLMDRNFPDREVVGIQCSDLVWGQGAIHCITQPWYGLS
ncbi:agmatine deiminase [Fodinibius salinus]|uniref:Agmatine deiminase n=1 Tax=Fodinibius salinus TaxID=860790 RepID=A0A5D3YN15_9BACT|nr:agmatine deiminase family protein [Fodinibius salinus]TYP95300.1 agmatine deiminase [Fodinibius salinus]